MKKSGLFGGTFDPIHYGHLRSAWEVKEKFGFDRVFLIPAAVPPHKKAKTVENPAHRLEMIRCAIAGIPELTVSDIELKRTGPSYTIDTVCHFKSECRQETALYFIIGSDAFLELDTWKAYEELLVEIPFIVMIRPDAFCADVSNKIKYIHEFLSSRISKRYAYRPEEGCIFHPDRPPVFIHKVTALDISSTHIRDLIKQKKSVRFLVPAQVEHYITTRGLYK